MNPEIKRKFLTPANIVTLVRIVCIPIFVAIYICPWPALTPDPEFWANAQPWIAIVAFILISATDAIDGHLARSRNEVTDFGKFLDPLADKILVCAALLSLVQLGELNMWFALIILAREFIISGLRMLSASSGIVIAASWYGKIKTNAQIIAIVMFIMKDTAFLVGLGTIHTVFNFLAWIVMIFAVVMTIMSMVDYFIKSKDVFGVGEK